MVRQRRAAKVDGYDLGVLYVPSHRHKNLRLKDNLVRDQKFMMIHNFKPTITREFVRKYRNGKRLKMVKSDCITTKERHCKNPNVPQDMRDRMQEDWSSVLLKNPLSHFICSQYKKHGQHHKYETDAIYHEKGIRLGKKYMKGGRHDLMRLMKRRGYIPGYRYSCKRFVEALNEELGHPVLVTFKDTKFKPALGKMRKMKYLDEISSLYGLNSKRNRTARDQVYDKEIKYFHLEDFSRVLKGTRLIDASLKLMSMRFGLWGRKSIY